MAIEIKRTPVLTGESAKVFLNTKTSTKESKESIALTIAKAKKILSRKGK